MGGGACKDSLMSSTRTYECHKYPLPGPGHKQCLATTLKQQEGSLLYLPPSSSFYQDSGIHSDLGAQCMRQEEIRSVFLSLSLLHLSRQIVILAFSSVGKLEWSNNHLSSQEPLKLTQACLGGQGSAPGVCIWNLYVLTPLSLLDLPLCPLVLQPRPEDLH